MDIGNRRGASSGIIITGIICATAVLLVILILIFLSISGKPSNHSNDKPVSPETQQASETRVPDLETDAPAPVLPESETVAPDTLSPPLESDVPLKKWPDPETLSFSAETFYIEFPEYWAGHYSSKSGTNYYSFYNVENANAGYGGLLFSIRMYETDSKWDYPPEYRFLGEKDGIYYVADFPTDVQFDMDNEENTNLYYKMREDIDTILETLIMK